MCSKTLVMVLACRGLGWDMLETAVRNTWCQNTAGIDVLFYYGNPEGAYCDHDRLFVKCGEGYPNTGLKTVLAFEYALLHYPKVDYVFRTNLSSYVRLDKITEITKQFANSRVYAGRIGNHGGIPFASGCGYFISWDLMQLLVAYKTTLDYSYMDDVCFGKFLTNRGIPIMPMRRFDITSVEQMRGLPREDLEQYFHFRCKQENDRTKDVEIMNTLHSFFHT